MKGNKWWQRKYEEAKEKLKIEEERSLSEMKSINDIESEEIWRKLMKMTKWRNQ
jgi:hypothetical protein